MFDLVKQQIAECHNGLDKLSGVLDQYSRAQGLNPDRAVAALAKLRFVLAELATKNYGVPKLTKNLRTLGCRADPQNAPLVVPTSPCQTK
jgi:hypothetical protein